MGQNVNTHQSDHRIPSVQIPAHETRSSNSPICLEAQAAALTAAVLLGAAVTKATSSSSARSSNEVPPPRGLMTERSTADQTSQHIFISLRSSPGFQGEGSPTREFLAAGYISYTFSPRSTAEMYLASLFKINPRRVYTYHFGHWSGAFKYK